MKNIIIILFVSCLTFNGFSQQDPQFSHNMFNLMFSNPAYAGCNENINATAINRQQWIGFEGAPVSTIFSVDALITPFGLRNGVGITVLSDKLGFYNNTTLKFAYSYHLALRKGILSIGLDAGIFNTSLSPNWIIPDSDIHTPVSGDPSIPLQDNTLVFDMAGGVFYRTTNFYVGLSSSHLNQAELSFSDFAAPQLKRHYYLSAGYNIALKGSNVALQPSTFAYFDGSALQYNINTNIIFNKKFWLGASYRSGDKFTTFVALAGLEVYNGIKVGYAYDVLSIHTDKYSKGSHEFMLTYSFNIVRSTVVPKYKSVRFL